MSRVIGMYLCNAVSSCQRRLAQWCERKSLTDLKINISCKAQCEMLLRHVQHHGFG